MCCVLTVWCWSSIRDLASIGDRRLFETRRLLKHGHKNPGFLRHLVLKFGGYREINLLTSAAHTSEIESYLVESK